MIVERFKTALRKFQSFYARNGVFYTLLEIEYRFKSLTKKRHSCRSLLNKFPQKFNLQQNSRRIVSRCANIVDVAAEEILQELLPQLGIKQDSHQVLSALKRQLGRDAYYRALEECFTLEQFTVSSPANVLYPLLQASELPEITYPVRRRRILFITSLFPSPYHGGGKRILNFIKYLSEANDVYLATSFFPQEDGDVFHLVEPHCKAVLKIPRQRYGGNQAEILKWLKGKYMDIVHYEWPRSLENFNQAYGTCQIFTYMEAVSLRLLMDMEQVEPFTLQWAGKFSELLSALRLEVVDSALLHSRIAVTTKDALFFRDIYPYQSYTVLNHGVTFEEFILPDTEPEPDTLVFVGNYDHYPNVDAVTYFFNEVWADIRREVPHIRIYLVGAHPNKEILSLADGKQVIVTGGVEDVRPYIQKASVCIAPLLKGAGLRGKVIEYAALRRPFVATSIATTDLVFKDGVDYLRADTASEFSQKVVSLLRNKSRSREMAAIAFETARQNYDTRRLVDFLYRIYQHLESV